MFMVPILMSNLTNGFSGLAIYTDFYFALFTVINAFYTLAFFLLLDQDVAFNTERYANDADQIGGQIFDHSQLSYDPNNSESLMDLLQQDIFDREKVMNQKGIKMNRDGSTNNLAEYVWYSRVTKMTKFKTNYFYFFIWAYVSGALVFLLSIYALGGIMNSDGHVNNYWNAGVCIIVTNIISHHVMIVNETRNFTWFLTLIYVLSQCCLFLTILMNDSSKKSVFYRNQWSFLYSNPLFYLTLFLLVFIVAIPRKIVHIMEHVFAHPEF